VGLGAGTDPHGGVELGLGDGALLGFLGQLLLLEHARVLLGPSAQLVLRFEPDLGTERS
jgi:hypothetical protein